MPFSIGRMGREVRLVRKAEYDRRHMSMECAPHLLLRSLNPFRRHSLGQLDDSTGAQSTLSDATRWEIPIIQEIRALALLRVFGEVVMRSPKLNRWSLAAAMVVGCGWQAIAQAP